MPNTFTSTKVDHSERSIKCLAAMKSDFWKQSNINFLTIILLFLQSFTTPFIQTHGSFYYNYLKIVNNTFKFDKQPKIIKKKILI